MTFIVKQVYWYISQISGERLQDHWSSDFKNKIVIFLKQSVYNSVIQHNRV